MRVSECMTRDVRVAAPDETLHHAAAIMASIDAGMLPVGEDERLIGVITDRDIAIRGVAQGISPEALVRDIMSENPLYCTDTDAVEDVISNMADNQVRRLLVVDGGKRLVGVVSLGDLSCTAEAERVGEALDVITRPSMHRLTGGPTS